MAVTRNSSVAASGNRNRNHLALLLALLAFAGGYGLGRQQEEWQFTLGSPPAEDRDTFCHLEWMITDFQDKFISAYCDSSLQAIVSRSRWDLHQTISGGAHWPSTLEDKSAAMEESAALVERLTRKLEKLESGNPAPVLIRDLLRLNQQLGRADECERLLVKARQRYPEHSFDRSPAPAPRMIAEKN